MKAIDTLLIGVARIASRDVTGNAGFPFLWRGAVSVLVVVVGMLCALSLSRSKQVIVNF
jgi:hypothetical protein